MLAVLLMSVYHLFVGVNQVFIYAKLTLDSPVFNTALETQILLPSPPQC